MGTLTTNGHIRPLVAWFDLPLDKAAEFDYASIDLEIEVPRFVQYRGNWYDVRDAQVINDGPFGFPAPPGHPLHGWHRVQTDSAFTGIAFKFPDPDLMARLGLYTERYDYVVVGRWTSD